MVLIAFSKENVKMELSERLFPEAVQKAFINETLKISHYPLP